MKALAKKPIDWNLKPRIGKAIKTKDHSFLDVPYGSTVCNCGGKVVAHGKCQMCYDKFRDGLRKEHRLMRSEVKEENVRLKKLWKLF